MEGRGSSNQRTPISSTYSMIEKLINNVYNKYDSYEEKLAFIGELLKIIVVSKEKGGQIDLWYEAIYEMCGLKIFNETDGEKLYKEILEESSNSEVSNILLNILAGVLLVRGINYLDDKKISSAIRCFEISFEIGQLEAGAYLANFYIFEDRKKAEDYIEKVLSLYEKQSEKSRVVGELIAIVCTNVGRSYIDFNGEDNVSNTKAFLYFTKAAELEFGPGYYRLGYMYEHGFGCPQNDEMAIGCYRLAKAKGDEEAIAA